ncbi:hypothetical protein T11_8630 [Trichinella zimbabwensis]|uniref:Uncharacterized protein n=1 Tax=Trichinella zimbabwensis TaxID=268475 RepID=A0A0V1H531_9BILA|nr:hypothetical protein T11_8630 [Trichinella zimbabwensis]
MIRWGSGSKPPRNEPLIYRRAASRGTLTHPGAPLRRKPSIYWSGEDREASFSGARAVTDVETRCRRGDETASEKEQAQCDGGRTGADPEADPPAPPGGSLHRLSSYMKELERAREELSSLTLVRNLLDLLNPYFDKACQLVEKYEDSLPIGRPADDIIDWHNFAI